MAGRKLERMIDEAYDDEEVKRAVLEDAQRLGTEKDIEKGIKRLPEEEDAKRWLQAKKDFEAQQRQADPARQSAPPSPNEGQGDAGTIEGIP